jgi:hypothetical protein
MVGSIRQHIDNGLGYVMTTRNSWPFDDSIIGIQTQFRRSTTPTYDDRGRTSMGERISVKKFSDGDVYLWIEQESSIHLKAVTQHGDPVELTSHEAEELGKTLIEMARDLDSQSE